MKGSAKIVVSNTYLSSFEKIVEDAIKLSSNDKFANIILVVPDKFSLNAEQLLFAKTNHKSFFNIWTTTLSRLVSKVLENDDKNYTILTKNTGIMLVSKILMENFEKISTYKKLANNYSLAETMFNVINLLKSSGVKPNELLENFDDSNFGLKIKDIYCVYSEYEKQMTDKVDKITRLELFNKKAKNSQYIHNSSIFFGYFDSFTNAQLDTLLVLAKNAKNFEIGLCANTLQKNAWIYDNIVLNRVISKFKENSVKYEIKNITANLSEETNHILKNMFSFEKTNTFETQNVSIFEAKNIEEEIRNVANQIKYLLIERKYSFNDINIAVCGLEEYQNKIQEIFEEYDFSFYLDKQRDMLNHFFSKTICKIFDFVCEKNAICDCVSIIKSPLFDFEESEKEIFENYCYKYNLFGKLMFKDFKIENSQNEVVANKVRKVFDIIKEFDGELSKCSVINDYVDSIERLIEKIKSRKNIEKFAEKEPNIVQKSIDLQVFDKFFEILHSAKNMFGSVEIKKELFFEMIKSNLKSTNLKTVPLKCDAIFIGDSSQSTYLPKKALLILGANQNNMPVYQNDYGTITDAEIAKFKANKLITPTIKELNKREKFKIFNLLLCQSENLSVSYSVVTSGGIQTKSEFITVLQEIFTHNGQPISIYKNIQNYALASQNDEFLPYFVGSVLNAIKISNYDDLFNIKSKVECAISKFLEEEKSKYVDKKEFVLHDAKNIFFQKGHTSVSQIEKYFDCPFYHFMECVIKPQDKEKFEIKSYEIGNILHKIAENFVKKYIKFNFLDFDTNKFVDEEVEKITKEPDYKKIRENKFAFKNFVDEAKRFCTAIKHQIDCGNYKPVGTEIEFENYKLKNNITLKGKADRVDVCENDNSIRIIDYKTGSQSFDFVSAYYGIKLQLAVYMKIFAEKFDKKPAGALYMPVRNTWNKIGKNALNGYMLDGILLDDDLTRQNFDKDIIKNGESDVISVKYTSKGVVNGKTTNKSLSSKQFLYLQNYCLEILNNAVDEMISGYIQPKPYKSSNGSACDFCSYKAICKHEFETEGYRKLTSKTKYSFSKEEGGEQNE